MGVFQCTCDIAAPVIGSPIPKVDLQGAEDGTITASTCRRPQKLMLGRLFRKHRRRCLRGTGPKLITMEAFEPEIGSNIRQIPAAGER